MLQRHLDILGNGVVFLNVLLVVEIVEPIGLSSHSRI